MCSNGIFDWKHSSVGNGAAMHGHLSLLKLAVAGGFEPTEATFEAAVLKNSMPSCVVKWLHSRWCPAHDDIIIRALRGSPWPIQMADWLRKRGYEWTEECEAEKTRILGTPTRLQ
jgi:hypothetical protein